MNLYLYPQAANKRDGFGIAVEAAFLKQRPKPDDVIVWLTTYERSQMLHVKDNDFIIPRNKVLSIKTFYNLIRGRNRCEFSAKELSFLKQYEFDNIHCDDVIFYDAIRKLFPKNRVNLRFHNCFSRIEVRNQFLHRKMGFVYWIKCQIMKRLETKIFNDRNVHKIFLTDEDRNFYCSTYGIYSDSETWHFIPSKATSASEDEDYKFTNKLVWFGGIESHKESSVRWFVKEVFPLLLKKYPNLEFHLWGKKTDAFNNPQNHIFGHGFYNGQGLPLKNSLYVNPDIIGGGVKIKLSYLMEHKVPFISSPFGFEGYSHDLIDDKYCIVEEESRWVERISYILDNYGE